MIVLVALATVLQVTAVSPPRNAPAPRTAAVAITFDQPVSPASVTPASFRVFGRWSGPAAGAFSFSNGDRTVTFTPSYAFSAGDIVSVNLSHDLRAADLTPLRAAGFAYQFMTMTVPTPRQFAQLAVMSNRTNGAQTRIYGASASDLNEDGFLDLATINEVSADVRVCLNLADGSGRFGSFLAPQSIGVEASPNEPADFDRDGHADLCVAATESNSVWVLLGAGDGTFSSIQEIPVGQAPHGIAVLDADGDGDPDIANANNLSNNISLMINDGNGAFGAPVSFDAGVGGEYGLAAADMNNDGISDLVVAARDSRKLITLLGNGNATFTPVGPAQNTGGQSWVVVVGDVNGDRILDAAVANSVSNNAAILIGQGDGRFAAPITTATGAHTPSNDLADLDGDGDLDWVFSIFGAGAWRLFVNNGAGAFAFDQEFTAADSPSCAVPLDFDNDGDLDLALFDELADLVTLMENTGPPNGVGEAPPHGRLALLPNAPDPFRATTRIRFVLQEADAATLEVFDAGGRRVAARGLGSRPPGRQEVVFDGSDAAGRPLPAGVYYYRLTTRGAVQSDRMAIVR